MAMGLMEYGGGDLQRTTETINTGAGSSIAFPTGRRVVNAVYDNYNVLFINTNGNYDYAAYYIRGTVINQVPANTNISVTYTYFNV